MVKIVAHFYIKPDEVAAAKALFEKLVPASRAEKGCVSYNLYTNKGMPNHFTFIEEWKDADAVQAHGSAPAFLQALQQIAKHQEKDPKIIILEPYL